MFPIGNKTLLSLIGLVALAIVVLAGRHVAPLVLQADTATVATPSCDLQLGACDVDLGQGRHLRFALSPRPIHPAKPLRAEATLTEIPATKAVAVEFAGVDMDMGVSRVILARQTNGSFSAEASLPVCTTGRMRWRASVIIDAGSRPLAVPFEFNSPP